MSETHDESRIQTICLMIIAAAAITAGLSHLRDVLVPFVLAVFLAVALTPVVNVQVRRLRMPHALAVVLTLAGAFVALALVGMLVAQSMSELTANTEAYQKHVRDLVDRFTTRFSLDQAAAEYDPTEMVKNVIVMTTEAIVDVLSRGILVLIFLSFLLFGSTIGGSSHDGPWGDIHRRTQAYIVTKVIVSAITGVLVGLTLWIFDVQLALVFGLLAFLLNFIPSVGSIIATLLPVPMILLSSSLSTSSAVLAIAIPGAIQFTVGNVIEPKIMGKNAGLHPITILMALIFWGVLWGLPGMFLATPLTAMIRILLEKSPLCRPIAALMAGKVNAESDEQAT